VALNDDLRLMKRFLLIASVVQVLLGLAVGSVAATARAETKVREVAAQVVREEWLARLESETKRIAADAAERAAERAVASSVVPLIRESAAFHAEQNAKHDEVNRWMLRVETKLGLWRPD
jgi:hypothetical protein